MSNQSFQLNQSYHLWFEIFDKPHAQGFEADITSNYDYEIRLDGKKWVYIDIGLKLNYASIVYRSGFEFDDKTLTWKDIFVSDTVINLLKTAFAETQKGYVIFCEANKIAIPASCKIPEALLNNFANTILEQYTLYRSISDEQNAYLINTIILEAEPGLETYLMFKYTFDILQEVLFYHVSFNKEHNREVFSDIIPLPRYFTLRNKTKAIEYENVSLSGVDMIMFFQCLDCALQMILGDKADALISYLEKQGFDAETQAAYIQSGTNQFNLLNQMLKDSNARIMNLENRVDWLSIMK
jgi:hypothetical protein